MYAIYKNRVGGLVARKYIDNKKDAPPYVSESSLPIITNGGMGYTSFGEEGFDGETFVEFRKENNLTFEERFPMPFIVGFIAPDGTMYSCDIEAHEELAKALVEKLTDDKKVYNPQLFLEQKGYLKITAPYKDREKKIIVITKNRITKAQENAIVSLENAFLNKQLYAILSFDFPVFDE